MKPVLCRTRVVGMKSHSNSLSHGPEARATPAIARDRMAVGLAVALVTLALVAVPVQAEVRVDLERVQDDYGDVYYHGMYDAGPGNPQAYQVLVLIDASRANLRKCYSITLFHAVGEYIQSSMEATFEVTRTGRQYVLIQPSTPLAMKADWWVYLDGDEPLPTVRRLNLREQGHYERRGSVVSPNGVVSSDELVLSDRCYVVRPYNVVAVSPERVFPRLPIVRRHGYPAWHGVRDHRVGGLRPNSDGLKPRAARNQVGARKDSRPGERKQDARGNPKAKPQSASVVGPRSPSAGGDRAP